MKKVVLIIILCLACAAPAWAKGDYGSPGEFLIYGAGARSMGLGRAFTGLADDASASYYNPAGLALQNPIQFMMQHVILFYDTMYDFAAVTYPVSGMGTFGLSYIRLASTGYEFRDINWNNTIGNFGVSQSAAMLSYGKDLTAWLCAGANFKFVWEQMAAGEGVADNGTGFGLDLGLMFIPRDFLSIGVSVINVLPPSVKVIEAVSYPVTLKIGFALKLLGDRIIPLVDMEKSFVNKDFKFRLGLEGYPIQNLALRAGYNESEITFGAGYNIRPVKLDYSMSYTDLGFTYRMSVTYYYGGFDISLKADPSIFSPVGVKKSTTISIYAETKNEISEWELNIANEDGDIIRTYSGDDKPPLTIMWNGKDDRGLPAGDGEYRLTMKVKEKTGKTLESNKEKVRISSSMPMGQPGSIKLEE